MTGLEFQLDALDVLQRRLHFLERLRLFPVDLLESSRG
jgi:hypothetical protein